MNPLSRSPGRTTSGGHLLLERMRRRAAVGPERGIEPVPPGSALPLSFGQQGLWVLDQLRPGCLDYLVPIVLRLKGDLSTVDLGRALNELVRRHEILRTRYETGPDGRPVQIIDPPAPLNLAFDDLRGQDRAAVQALLDQESGSPVDLATGPILRARLIQIADREHLLVLTTHHIAVDGWSVGLIVAELSALSAGEHLPEPEVQYVAAAVWQRQHVSGDLLRRGLDYWTDRLRDLPPLELALDRPRPAVWDGAGATICFDVPADVGRQVAARGQEQRATSFMVHLAVFWSLLHRYTGQTDFAVSTPIAGRTRSETESIVGHFVNLLVLRADLTGDPTFSQLLDRARETSIQAYAHQETPFEAVVEALEDGRDLSRHPLVRVNLTLQNTASARFVAGSVTGEMVPVPSQRAKFDVGLTLEERPDGSITGELTFPKALLDERTVERMADHYVRLLAEAVAEPGRRVGELAMLGPDELHLVVRTPTVTSPAPLECLHERFAANARRRPSAVAVTFEGRCLTYGELDVAANQLAHRLREVGAGREQLVAICLPRGLDLVVALLATLKAGSAYLPLDPDHPAHRNDLLIRDAAATIVLTRSDLSSGVSGGQATAAGALIRLDNPDEIRRLGSLPTTAPTVDVHPDDLAYVIYTSGSTGRPKGVQVTHANVIRLFSATRTQYDFGPDDVWALFHSSAFDFSVWEIWGAFLPAGRLVIVPYPVSRSPWDLVELIVEEGVTVLNQTPSAFLALIDLAQRDEIDLGRLRLIIFGGEAVDIAVLEPWWERFGDETPQLVNMYGITETTVHVTCRPLRRADVSGERSPIGRPIADLAVYVLDPSLRPLPVGAQGEIHVAGPGVARGYLGQPGLTADRFVPDPFGAPGGRLYRSGDTARITASGELAFVGRTDDQVKIRGYRIELGEVRWALTAHPDVEAAVVSVHERGPGDRTLVAHLVARAGTRIEPERLQTHLAAHLPAHMIPSALTVVPALPLTASGKVDLRALPTPGARVPAQPYLPPATREEATLTRIWAETLELDQVGVQDRFFDLGGDSIRAVRLIGAMRTQGFPYSVQDLFRHQSISELVHAGSSDAAEWTRTQPFALLAEADRAGLPAGLVDAYPMAQVQIGMVYEMLADPDLARYHNVTSYLIRDDVAFDPKALATAIESVVAQHEILRTSFDLAGFSEPLQLVHPYATANFLHDDLRDLPFASQSTTLSTFRARERTRTFDLATAPLVRLHVHQISSDRWYLSITEFHAILDGWSHNSLISQLLSEYRTARDHRPVASTRAPVVRYADFVAQERSSLGNAVDRQFWAARVRSAERLSIPVAWADPDGPAAYAVEVRYRDLEGDLRALATSVNASLKSVLLAAHVAVWRAVAGREPFHFGLVCNGRTEVAGGDRVAGMFLNPVPFVAPSGTQSWRHLIRRVFEEEVNLWPHRRYPLPAMQQELGQGRRLIEVAFNYLDFHVLDREMVDTSGSTDISPNEFPLAVSTQGGNLVISGQSARVGRSHAELLARMYRQALRAMLADPAGNPHRDLLPEEERQDLLDEGRRAPIPVPDLGVHELVHRHAMASPDAVAVEGSGRRLTYRQLDARALDWAARFRAEGVAPGDLVGLCLPREPDLVAAILGILICGAGYVPVDPQHPVDRISAILRSAGARVVAAPQSVTWSPVTGPTVVSPASVGPQVGSTIPIRHPDREELVYVAHTSGSSGRPKGVMVRHGALIDRVRSITANLGLVGGEKVVAVVPLVTDVAQLAIFVALTGGGRVVLAAEDLARDPASLAELLAATEADLLQASPTTWRLLTESGWSPPANFRALSGGERMPADLVRRLQAGQGQVWDMYGPTEATVFCFGTRLDGAGRPTWMPAANTAIYLLDDDLEPVMRGVVGQIYVGGGGLARGYLGRPDRTADAFLPDPHAPAAGSRMYATGDLGRRHRDGRIEILGRLDHQVKIRGHRVELGEIENTLAAHPEVIAAAVNPVPGPGGETQLAGYLILTPESPGTAELRRFCELTLPEHLVPTHLVPMESFPRMPNGKIDRSRLPVPEPVRPALSTPYLAPVGRVEETIAAVWAEVLEVEQVGRDDDFFAVGGHSLLVLRVIARLAQAHGLDVGFRDFLTSRTVRGIAATLESGSGMASTALVPLRTTGPHTPLFCLHPAGGSVHWYRELADALATNRPLAAFEWPGLHGGARPAANVPDIAARYLDELRAVRRAGPYHVLGWCGSSAIAWEMARRLEEDGETVRLLLLDPVADLSATEDPGYATRLEDFRLAEKLFEALQSTPPGHEHRELREAFIGLVRNAVDDLDVWVEEADLQGWDHRLRAWRELLQARLSYRFPVYSGAVELIVCDELADERHEAINGRRYEEYLAGWRQLAVGGLRVHRIPGDHLGVLRAPQVSALIDVIIDGADSD